MTTCPPLFGLDLRGRSLAGRYRLDAIVGSGGTANVYKAYDRALRRRVAVKVIHPEYARSEEQLLRIQQEAGLAARIEHPNLATIHDYGEDRSTSERMLYLVMPLLEGPTLRELVLAGALGWQRAVLLVRQLLAGLGVLHSLDVLHRDLKASNCIVTQDQGRDCLLLLDFGLAKVTRPGLFSRAPVSIGGCIIGTIEYLSPEQVRGLPADIRSDLYSVGVLLYELLTRRVPFSGSDYDVLSAHVHNTPPPLVEHAPNLDIPSGLDSVVQRALAKLPDERYRSAAELSAALDAVMSDAGVELPAGTQCPESHRGCGEAQACLAAWAHLDARIALQQASEAERLNPSWSALRLMLSLIDENS